MDQNGSLEDYGTPNCLTAVMLFQILQPAILKSEKQLVNCWIGQWYHMERLCSFQGPSIQYCEIFF